jgi:DNA polymerase/3'-5' exonuclease PolX
MSEMQIRTFGQTAETTVTREQVVATMKMIQKVRQAKGQTDFVCPYFYAKDITVQVQADAVAGRIETRARRMSAAGRFRRARRTYA